MKPRHRKRRQKAIAWIEVLAVVAGIFLLAAVLLLPSFANCNCKSVRINCASNLKQVGLAYRMWGDDNESYPMRFQTNDFDGPSLAAQQKMYVYYQVMSNELSTPKVLVCPADDRTEATNFDVLRNSNISYFAGMDADETMPQMFLAGDRNLLVNDQPAEAGVVSLRSTDKIAWTLRQLHRGQGNVALADGSVQGDTSSGLQQALRHTGTNLILLALP